MTLSTFFIKSYLLSDVIDDFLYEKSLWDPIDVGTHINTRGAIKWWDPFNDGKLIITITQFNLGNRQTRLILVVRDPPNVSNYNESPYYDICRTHLLLSIDN